MKKVLLMMLALMFVAGCAKMEKTPEAFIAKVNDEVISEEDFLEELSRIPQWAISNFAGEEGKTRFLDEMINKELIYQDALSRGMQNDKDVEAKVEEFRKMSILGIVLKQEIEDKIDVTEAEIKEFYDNNPEDFKKGAEVRARHILVDTEDKAKVIMDSIIKGESFAELAKTFSKDTSSAENGGDLGFFSKGRMIPEFEEAAFSLKKGEVSMPVKTNYGFHIIEVTDRREGSQIQFEDAQGTIQTQLVKDKQKVLFEAYLETLKGKSDIKKDPEKLAAMQMPWETGEAPEQVIEPAPETAPETAPPGHP